MATTKERILITLTPDMAQDLEAIAKHERSPKATVAARLMRQALEDEEDRRLSKIGDAIMENPGSFISSEEFWKQVEAKRSKRN